ncbi:MAG: 4Fe-4S dicluster domain-containing protein [Planctomycetes bacterium]|nr:4Fe-4S dicluster domain-containing protein [Planctomycetota bacterium]
MGFFVRWTQIMSTMFEVIPEKCTSCMQCELACSWVQTGTFRPSRSLIRVHVFDEEASYAPYACTQCDEAWCMTACPVNAITIDARTGAKIVVERLCIGCHLCTIACPFGTIFTTPETGTAAKCNLCGGAPACVVTCPTAALVSIEQPSRGGWFEPWSDLVQRRFADAHSN